MCEEKINIASKDGVVTILKGNTLPIEPTVGVILNGQIDSVFRYLEKRHDTDILDQKQCSIEIDRENYTIELKTNEDYEKGAQVKGKIEIHPLFIKFGINSSKTWTTFELADFVKMHRSYFESKAKAAELITVLTNFEGKVNREVQEADDSRGNKSAVVRQVVESNIPTSIKVNIPIFKGKPAEELVLEVNITAGFTCSFISPEAKEIEQTTVDGYIDNQEKAIIKICKDIVIINK